jgi:hypothetical protein
MPTDNTSVGPLSIPVDAGNANEAFQDRTILGLLDYLGHWLRAGLNDKLGQMQGPETSAIVSDVCPVENLFPFNHEGTFVRRNETNAPPLPGMWAWEDSQESSADGATILYDVVRREVRVQYIFPQVMVPKGVNARSGLIPAVSRIMAKAVERGRRSDYGFDGDADGTPIRESCSWLGFAYRGGRAEAAAMLPSGGQSQAATRAAGAEKRFFPSFVGTFWIWERIGLQEPAEADASGPSDFTIAIKDESDDESLDLMERIVPQPED